MGERRASIASIGERADEILSDPPVHLSSRDLAFLRAVSKASAKCAPLDAALDRSGEQLRALGRALLERG